VTDDELSKLYRTGMRHAAAPRADDAPSLEAMLRVVRGEANEAERLRTLDRVMASEVLREEFALLSAVAEGERRSLPRRRGWMPVAAAAALLLVASGLVWQSRRAPVDDVVRGGDAALQLVSPRERLDASRVFTWRSAGSESRYRFQLRDAEGGVLFDTVTRDTTLELPINVLVSPERTYRWWIRAERPDGSHTRSVLVPIRGSAMD
jgi:hypothetical protein